MTINLAIAGYGYWGKKIAHAIKAIPEFSLTAIFDTNQTALLMAEKDFPVVPQFRSMDLFIDNANMDALWIAVPVTSHASMAIIALEAGLHVLLEKPFAQNSNQAEEILNKVKRTKKILLPGHIYLHDSSIQQLRQTIEESSLGQICYIDMVRTGYGIIRPDINVIWDLGIHDIIISSFLLNEIPCSVSAWGASFLPQTQINSACLLLSFQSGAQANIRASWLEGARRRQITVVGTKGMAILSDEGSYQSLKLFYGDINALKPQQNKQFTDSQRSNIIQKQYKIPNTNGIVTEARHFAACISKKVKPICDAVDGMIAIHILEAAQLSLECNGKEIPLKHINTDKLL